MIVVNSWLNRTIKTVPWTIWQNVQVQMNYTNFEFFHVMWYDSYPKYNDFCTLFWEEIAVFVLLVVYV